MSKIRLHGSSSGYMEIAPPAAASSATVTLPNSAGEILLSDGSAASLTQIPAANLVGVCTSGLTKTGGFGKILQVKQAFKNDTQSTSSSSFIDLTGLSQSITVGTTGGVANKVLVMYNINSSGQGLVKDFNIVRGSTNIAQPANSSVARFATQSMFVDADHFLNGAFTFLDTPAAGTHTYKMQMKSDGVNTFFINRYYGNDNYHSVSSLTLMEVKS